MLHTLAAGCERRLALCTASLECLLLLHTRADVGLYSLKQLVRIYLLKLAQNLLNESCCFSLLRYSLALEVPVAMTVQTYVYSTVHMLIFTTFLHFRIAVDRYRYAASPGGCTKYSTFCMFYPVYYFIWAYGALNLLHALPLQHVLMRSCHTCFQT